MSFLRNLFQVKTAAFRVGVQTAKKTTKSIGLYTESFAVKSSGDPYRPYKIAFLSAIPLATLYLGWWQVQRLEWKEELLATINDRIKAEPIVLNSRILSDEVDPSWEYRIVLARGEFLHEREILLGPRTHENQIGFYVITPFRLENGYIILVKRGWVSREKKNPASRRSSLTEGTVTIQAQVRLGEKGNRFTPDNDPGQELWFYTNVAEMAKYTGSLPLLVDEVTEDKPYGNTKLIQEGIPVPRAPTIPLSNNHTEYAFTWFTLSFFSAIMTIMFARRGGRRLPTDKNQIVTRQPKF